MRDLNLRHVRGLLEVRDRGSISAAAHALGTSQPALTQGIAKLEQQLAHKLFERRARGLVITSAGETAALRMRAALDHLAQGMRAVSGKAVVPERRLSLAQVHALLALVEAGSFGAAGAATGMAAASIHRAVRALEEAVSRPLAERRGRAVAINAHGRRLARSGRLALAEFDALSSDLGLLRVEPTIVVGTTPLARAFLVPEAMAMMNAQGGSAGFRVLEGSWGELAEALRDGLVDILVGEAPPEVHPELELRVLHDAPVVIAAGRNHPLAGRKAGIAKLASFPWIVAPRGTALRDAWERLFAGRPVQAPVECGSIMIIGRLLTSSEQLTLATPDQVALQIRSGLLARIDTPVAGRIAVGTVVRRGWRPPTAHARFLVLLGQVAAGLGGVRKQPSLVEKRWV